MCVRDLPSLRIDKPHLDESAANVPARHPRYPRANYPTLGYPSPR